MKQMIPSPDVLPLPGPDWLFLILLIVTFTIHLIFMNFFLGGTLIAAASHLRGKTDTNHALLAKKIYKFIPAVIALAVNFGIPPLLFVQVLYGHFLYSSSILIAVFWFAVIPLLILGYYGVYSMRFGWERLGKYKKYLVWLITLIFAAIGFIFVNNMTLMLKPDTFVTHYFNAPSTGSLNLSDLSIYPRYLHVFLGAVALTGFWILIIGIRKKTGDEQWSNWAAKYGANIFFYSTLTNIFIGILFLLAHPQKIVKFFLGNNISATVILIISILLTFILLVIIYKVKKNISNIKLIHLLSGLLLLIMFLMVILRHFLRFIYLESFFKTEILRIKPQWIAFIIFLTLFVFFMMPAIAWMIKVVLKAERSD